MVEWDLVMVEGLVQDMEMKVDVTNRQEDRMVAIAIAADRDLDMATVQDTEADVVNRDMAIAQAAIGEVEVEVVNQVTVAQVAIGEVEVEKAAIAADFQDILMISI